MRIFRVLLIASALAGLSITAADLPSGESVLERAVEQSGGAEAYAKIKTIVITGTVEMVGHNISGALAMYQQGEKSYTSIELPGIGKAEEGYDGQVAWEMNPLQGARTKDGEEKAVTRRASRFSLLGSWRDYYTSVRTVGEKNVEGKAAWQVELTPKEGKVETFYFDKESGLLAGMSQTIPSAMGEIPVEVTIGDYRVVDGLKTPFAMTQKAMSQVLSMRFEKVSYNAEIPPGRFDLPPAVKELIASRQKQ